MSASEEVDKPITGPKSSVKLIFGFLIGILIVLISAIVGTLYITGYLSKTNVSKNDQKISENISHDNTYKDNESDPKLAHEVSADINQRIASKPIKVQKKSPDFVRFEYSYKHMDKELLSNLTGSRKVIMIQVAFMTSYDERVFKNIEKHEFAIRGAMLDVMRQYTEQDTIRPDFRQELADRLKDASNSILVRYEDFGGIDAIHFTSFIIQ